MQSIAAFVYHADKLIFAWFREHFAVSWLDSVAPYLSNLYFLTPWFVFLTVLVMVSTKKNGFLVLLYVLGAMVLSYQACFMLTQIIGQPAPYVIEYVSHKVMLPACPPEGSMFSNYDFSFPDWETAALTAFLVVVVSRLKASGIRLSRYHWVALVFVMLIRMYAGHAYPLDLLFGWLVGRLIGFLLAVFAKNMDIVLNPPPSEMNQDLP